MTYETTNISRKIISKIIDGPSNSNCHGSGRPTEEAITPIFHRWQRSKPVRYFWWRWWTGLGGSITDDDSALDVKDIDLSTVHYLSGPIRVVDTGGNTSKPADLLAVGDEWGFTAIFDRENGGGFLTDHFPWQQKKSYMNLEQTKNLTGVRFPGLTHPGIVGTAPSSELLDILNKRERELEETGLRSLKLREVMHSRPLANLPSTKVCLLGKIEEGTTEWERIARETARTIPGR